MLENSAHISLEEFTGALEQCLAQTFREPVRLEEVDQSVPLPPVLKIGYRFCGARIVGRPCLLMAARRHGHLPADLAVHISLVRSAVDAMIIFAAPWLSPKHCLALMAEGVSFIVPGHLPHIPELGMDLRIYGNAPMPRDTDDLSVKDEGWIFPHLPRSV